MLKSGMCLTLPTDATSTFRGNIYSFHGTSKKSPLNFHNFSMAIFGTVSRRKLPLNRSKMATMSNGNGTEAEGTKDPAASLPPIQEEQNEAESTKESALPPIQDHEEAAETLHNMKAATAPKDNDHDVNEDNPLMKELLEQRRPKRACVREISGDALMAGNAAADHDPKKNDDSSEQFPFDPDAMPKSVPVPPPKASEAATSPLRKQYLHIDGKGCTRGPTFCENVLQWVKIGICPPTMMIKGTDETDYVTVESHPDFKDDIANALSIKKRAAEILQQTKDEQLKRLSKTKGKSSVGEGKSPLAIATNTTTTTTGNETAGGPTSPAATSDSDEKHTTTSIKRAKGTTSKSISQVKDAVVRSQIEMLTDRLATCQTMTGYKEDVQVETNPEFHPLLLTYDEIVQRPDEHLEGARARDCPMWSVFLPSRVDPKELGARLEALGKAMQDPSKHNKKKNKGFDFKVVQDKDSFYDVHYGGKRKKGDRKRSSP